MGIVSTATVYVERHWLKWVEFTWKDTAEMGGARVCLGVLGAEHNTQHPCALL